MKKSLSLLRHISSKMALNFWLFCILIFTSDLLRFLSNNSPYF
nr:MAG TPA: hypothetical protein [Caudoviricetes sp.]